MDKTFDFEKIGKRMPYTVPDDFFTKLEENVVASLSEKGTVKSEKLATAISGKPKSSKKALHIAIRSLLAAAAAVALFFVVRTTLPKSEPELASANDFESVQLAFNNLSTDDQDFLIQVYEDEDILMNDFEFNP